jgi:hypothetical protein
MEKMIVLRFQAKCKTCGLTIPAGERAIWLGKGTGTKHVRCTVNRTSEITKPKDEVARNEFTIDYAELREAWRTFHVDPMTVYRNPANRSAGLSLVGDWTEEWSGSSIPEMADFIANGYRVAGLEGVTSLMPGKPRRKIRYAEEGDELLLELAWSGADTPFMDWEKRVTKPGLSVEIHMTFSAGFPAKTIVQYQRWIARALQTLDENGVDMEVVIVSPLNNLCSDDPSLKTKTRIRVRKAGEASDFSNWSAMFSPGGFRQLVIMSTGIHADRIGKVVGAGYGSPQAYGSWEVAYDEERALIVIGNDNYNRDFPEAEMTEKLRNVLAKLNG